MFQNVVRFGVCFCLSLVATLPLHSEDLPPKPSGRLMSFNDGVTGPGGALRVIGEFHHTLYWEFFRKTYESYRSRCDKIASKGEYRIPPIIHMVWLGSPPSKECLANLASWKKFHPGWEVKLWTEAEIETIAPKMLCMRRYRNRKTTLEQKSLIARYNILRIFGGLYVDPDYECLGSYKFIHQSCDFYAGLCQHDPSKIDPSLFGCKKGHIILTMCAGTIDLHCVGDRNDPVQVDRRLGSGHFTRFFIRCSMYDMPPLRPNFIAKGKSHKKKHSHRKKKGSLKHHSPRSKDPLVNQYFSQTLDRSLQKEIPASIGEITVLPPAIVNPYMEECARYYPEFFTSPKGKRHLETKNALSIRHWNTPFLHKPICFSYCADFAEISTRAKENNPSVSAKLWRRILRAFESGKVHEPQAGEPKPR